MSHSLWVKLRDRIEGVFSGTEQTALRIATTAAHYVEENGGQVLRDAASVAVQAALTAVQGGGTVKAAFAATQVIGVLEKEGIPVVKSAVNLAIEMALAELKTAGVINKGVGTPT